jgi:hypothetical protein
MAFCTGRPITENTLKLNMGAWGNSCPENGGDDAMMPDAAICLPHAVKSPSDSSTASGELAAATSNNEYCL